MIRTKTSITRENFVSRGWIWCADLLMTHTPHPTFISFNSIFHVFPIKRNHTVSKMKYTQFHQSTGYIQMCWCGWCSNIYTIQCFKWFALVENHLAHKCPADILTFKSWYLNEKVWNWTFKGKWLGFSVNIRRKLVNSNSIFVQFSDEWNLMLRGARSDLAAIHSAAVGIVRKQVSI